MTLRRIAVTTILASLAASGCATTDRARPGAVAGGLANLQYLRPGRTMRASSSSPKWRNTNEDARPVAPGETIILADLQGPGVIQHIWSTIAPGELAYGRLMVIRMYWDGEENPSVECPLGDFFGVGHGLDRPFTSAPVSVSSHGRARNCYWPMPFRKSARITITNEGRKAALALFWYVDWQKMPHIDDDAAYFHAQYRQEHPTLMGRNYLIADIEGRGHYVGTLLNVRQRTSDWWGEGDDFFFIDGEEEPSLKGTGSEDYFCDAWGLRRLSYPYYGVTVHENYWGMSRTSAYRWHIPDPVSFERSLRVEIEHKGVTFKDDGTIDTHFGEREDDFSSVAFWYQVEPHKPLPPLPPAYERVYHDPDDLIEAEDLHEADKITASEGKLARQYGPWSNSQQLQWHPTIVDQTLTVPFEVSAAGTYDISVFLTKAINHGIFQAELDGHPIGKPIDLYEETFWTRGYYLGSNPLTAGKHQLSFRATGSSEASFGLSFGIDCFIVSERK